MFFVNLTLRAVKRDPRTLAEFLSRGVNPELGLDPVLMDMVDMAWHREMAARLAGGWSRPWKWPRCMRRRTWWGT